MPDDHWGEEGLTKQDFEKLARFRFGIRRYLRFSEEAVRHAGLTPQHYQLLLALKGFPGREWAIVGELADGLQLRHHSVVELVNRAQAQGLVQRAPDPADGRVVRVALTREGQRVMASLGAVHRSELKRMQGVLDLPILEDAEPGPPVVPEAGVADPKAPHASSAPEGDTS